MSRVEGKKKNKTHKIVYVTNTKIVRFPIYNNTHHGYL